MKAIKARPNCSLSFVVFILFATCSVLAGQVRAEEGGAYWYSGKFFDGSTMCKWKRTWHGPNSLDQPLSRYYVPRPMSACGRMGYSPWDETVSGCSYGSYGGCENGNCAGRDDHMPAGHVVTSCPGMQAGFERLGQIPNEIGIAGAVPNAPAPPGS
jgi:hypothetical protein